MMESTLVQVSCIIGALAVMAFGLSALMKKRTLYMPGNADTSQPIDFNAEKRREDAERARGARVVWVFFGIVSAFICLIAALAPTFKKVSAALADATSTPTVTGTATITSTPTVTNTPRETFTPRATWTPINGTPGSMLDTVLTPVASATSRPSTPTARVVNVVVVHTQIVQVQVTKIVNVAQTVVVTQIVPVTVIVTETPTPTVTQTPTITPTVTETPTLTPSPTETPTQ